MTRYSNLAAAATRVKSTVSIAAVISQTVALKHSGRHFVGLCPFHKENTPSFTVFEDHYYCFGCNAHGDLIRWIMVTRRLSFPAALRHLNNDIAPGSAEDRGSSEQNGAPISQNIAAEVFLRLWDQGTNPTGTVVDKYLWSRGGLSVPDGAPIRFHPHCQRGGRKLPGGPEYWPAVLALMTDPLTGEPVGLHRTYLLPDGSSKAPTTTRGKTILRPKMILGTWGVVRLAADEAIGRALGMAEGIETALTAMQTLAWGPVWAAGTQDGIKSLPVLPWIEALTIFADADDTGVGIAAAYACAQRWAAADREVLIHIPPEGQDWNDAV